MFVALVINILSSNIIINHIITTIICIALHYITITITMIINIPITIISISIHNSIILPLLLLF
ncbi:hypothetical protein T492DRAFT_922211 [Pavlovales sp. CCMP2436]|nr:hypothetical protein T492DRAFT_922211 [Pavlovales sp. CCMP2436]